MKDPHQNLFYYYGKHYNLINKGKENEERVYDSQLENNTTKAFINLFEIGDKKNDLLKYFLRKILIIPKKIKFDNVRFNLQVQTESGKSIPDASIIIDDELFLYFENKITKTKENKSLKKQLIRHWNATEGKEKFLFLLAKDYKEPNFVLKLRKKGINIKFLSWMEIYSIIEDGGLENAFVRQFLNYLKVIGMAPFKGFEKEDFDVCLGFGDAYNVKEKVKILGEKIKPKGFTLRMQNIKDRSDYIGCNIYDERICRKLRRNYYDIPHFSMGLEPQGLRIYLIIHSKPAVKKFLKKIADGKLLCRLIRKLQNYEVVLYDRKYFLPGLAEYKHDMRIRSKYFGKEEMLFVVSRAKKIGEKRTNAIIQFENNILRKSVIKDKDIIRTAKETLKRLFELYKFIIEDYY